jgi:hypothetical protein
MKASKTNYIETATVKKRNAAGKVQACMKCISIQFCLEDIRSSAVITLEKLEHFHVATLVKHFTPKTRPGRSRRMPEPPAQRFADLGTSSPSFRERILRHVRGLAQGSPPGQHRLRFAPSVQGGEENV